MLAKIIDLPYPVPTWAIRLFNVCFLSYAIPRSKRRVTTWI